MLRYSDYDIVLQEVPNEISLCFTLTGCPLACKGCHSEYIWNPDFGEPLTADLLEKLIDRYDEAISCVLFMGGEWRAEELLQFVRIAKAKKLKTALYTGLNMKKAPYCPAPYGRPKTSHPLISPIPKLPERKFLSLYPYV